MFEPLWLDLPVLRSPLVLSRARIVRSQCWKWLVSPIRTAMTCGSKRTVCQAFDVALYSLRCCQSFFEPSALSCLDLFRQQWYWRWNWQGLLLSNSVQWGIQFAAAESFSASVILALELTCPASLECYAMRNPVGCCRLTMGSQKSFPTTGGRTISASLKGRGKHA